MHKTIIALALAIALAGCGLSPKTVTNAFIGHAQFPSLSMAVSDCLSTEPAVRDDVTPAWNRLVEKWDAADELPRDETLIKALLDAPAQVAEAKADWTYIRATIAAAGIDCGPAVKASVANVEQTFGEIESAIQGSEQAVYILEWFTLLSTVVTGRGGEVVRL